MNEEQWLACTDPVRMTAFLSSIGRPTDRKLRLFACACIHRFAALDEGIAEVVRTSERYADGEATWNQLAAARKTARQLTREAMQRRGQVPYGAGVALLAGAVAHPAVSVAVQQVVRLADCRLVHDVFGNPFRLAPRPARSLLEANEGLVAKLAQAAYENAILPQGELYPIRLAVLADALEETGADAALIEHFREQRRVHVRGCWLIDLLTGRA